MVLDSVGIGALPDAAEYGDESSNTLGNIAKTLGSLRLPNLESLGLGNLGNFVGINPVPQDRAAGSWGRLFPQSPGKDTITGHWEMMGIILDKPFKTYPSGFPQEQIEALEAAIGRKILGNRPASGTQIIEELGDIHIKTGRPIVYTSADSVLQIAAHEDVIPVDTLYEMCEKARNIFVGDHLVARIIARPFIGKPGSFSRTERRKDFSVDPPRPTALDAVQKAGLPVIAIGKISDIFNGKGIDESIHTKDNMDGIDKLVSVLRTASYGLVFANLVDFDTVYGHRNNVEGYAKALEAVDSRIPEILRGLKPHDLLIICADHGCDPTTPSTDHSREYTPLLITGPKVRVGVNLGTRPFSDVGSTVLDWLGASGALPGKSFLPLIA